MRKHVVYLLVSLGVYALAQGADQPVFEVNILAQGINEGMEIAIDKDGRIFVAERKGKVKLYTPETNTTTELIDLKSDTRGESGLIGIALDTKFKENGWIYLYHTVPFETENGPYLEHHLGRFTFEDGKIDPASEKILLKVKAGSKKRIHEAGSIALMQKDCSIFRLATIKYVLSTYSPPKPQPTATIFAARFYEFGQLQKVVMRFLKETCFRPAHQRLSLRSTSWD